MSLSIEDTIQLQNGQTMPRFGFGTWKLAKGEEAYNSVATALEVGYRHIDTARIYGNEESVGKAIADSKLPREKVWVTTKLWNDDHDDPLGAFEKSLGRLGLDYIDLYLIHWPVAGRNESWQKLQQLLEDGRLKALGVSNFTIAHLEALPGPTPQVNQFEISPFVFDQELIEYCKDKQVVVEAYSPLTQGERLNDRTIAKIAEQHHKTIPQVMLRWSLQHDLVVLPRSRNPDHIRENADIFDFELSTDDMQAINALDENFHTAWDPATIK